MGQLSVVWVVPPIVGLVAYVGVRLFWKKDELGIAARRKRSLGVNYAGAEKRLPQADLRLDRVSSSWGTATLPTVGVIGGFAIGWYLSNSQSPLVATLMRLAAFLN
jgi:hypothetical protein